MKSIMTWIVGHRALSWLLVFVLTAVFSPGLMRLQMDSSATGLFVKGDPDVVAYHQIREVFGDDIILSIVLAAPDIFTPDILNAVMAMTDESQGIDGVTRVVSLATASNLKGRDGILDTEMMLPYVPEDPEEMARLRADALESPIFRGELLNEKGTATAVHLFVEDRPNDAGFNDRLVAAANSMIAAARDRLGDRVRIYLCGAPFLKQSILGSIRSDGETLTPAAMLLVLAVLYLFFRSASAVLVPCLTGLASVLVTLGWMGLMGFAVNPVSVIIPTLLVVVGCTEDIHLLAEYGIGLRSGLERDRAIHHMAVHSGLAILLTSLTTFIGFITIAPNPIPMLREFALAAAFGMMANFVVTILMMPHILRWFKPLQWRRMENTAIATARGAIARVSRDHRRAVLIATAGFGMVAGAGCLLVKADTDYLRFFKTESPVRQVYRDFSRDMVGGTNLLVVVSGSAPGDMTSPQVLENVVALNAFLAERYDKAIGFTDFLRKMHQEMNDGRPEFYKLPESQALIAQYALLLNQDDLVRFVDFDFQRTAILVRASLRGSQVINREVKRIRRFIAANLSRDLHYTVTGEAVLVNKASDAISRELVVNLLYVFGTIFIFISLLFMSVKAGLLAMVPNLLPVIAIFALMGLTGIPLSISTFPVAIIALGIAVDDTIHLMVRYSKEIKRNEDNDAAMAKTFEGEFRPVMTTSLALILGFMVLLLADFGSTIEFGLLTAVAIAAALLSDLVVTPALLLTTPLVTSWDFIKLKVSGELTRTSPIFKGLSQGDIKRVAVLGAIREIPAGASIIAEGEAGRNMYVLLGGSAEVRRRGSDRVIGTVGKGEVVGEMSFLTGASRSASVIATRRVEALEINAGALDRVRRRFPRVAAKVFFNISQVLSLRLRDTTGNLTDH
jgi:predicted RND superfamily exporter protein